MRQFLAFLGAVALSVSVAHAADMPVKAPMMAPAYNWTGFYVGINGGGGTGKTTGGELPAFFSGNYTINGGMVGGTVGYNYQFNANWVVGIEADWDWASINGSATYAGGVTSAKARDLGTVRGRIGYAWSNWLLYGTGGWAWSSKVTAFCGGCVAAFNTESHSLNGYTVGGGVEYGITRNISVKAEYLYVNLGKTNFFVPAGCGGPCDIGANLNIFRVGANWRFAGM